MNCVCIDPAQVAKIWPLVSHLIREAMRKGGGDFEDIERAVLSGERLLWVAADEEQIWASAVTGLHTENEHKFCCIWACGGRAREKWLPLLSEVESFAKAEGCQSMRIYGRKGWARVFPDYKLIQITLEKAL